ncbi:MFS transporter [Acidiplasma sp.]|uniref:MFS transporter n=1 Tax=Acidiplasma sp. TaxID=1872114 RepID=UPI002584948F|nr:MFS transporter [Acidiplasma sp.]
MQQDIQKNELKSRIPFRLDRLPFSRWHVLVVIALGFTWILDGLEVTMVGVIGSVLISPKTLDFTSAEVGFVATAYLIGAVIGSVFFAELTDIHGRKKLFMVTLIVYILGTVFTAFSFNFPSFFLFRFITGLGIGGEYAAINSAIDELMPSKYRGRIDLAINGSWWVGTIVGSIGSLYLLNTSIFPINLGWRLSFAIGAILAIAVLLIRRYVPESPRWLLMHGKLDEAREITTNIEDTVSKSTGKDLEQVSRYITIKPQRRIRAKEIVDTLFKKYPKRTVLGLSLMAGQAFLYNAIFFTYALVLKVFYGIPSDEIGYFIIPFAVGNFVGPLVLGKLFDTRGRKLMISFTYIFSGALLMLTAYLFYIGVLNAVTQTLLWSIIFFFASAGASSAYLTVSEVFPVEMRAMAIAVFYSIGTGIGGVLAPSLFGILIASKSPFSLSMGYLLGASLMVISGIVEIFLGVKAEKKSLEDVARPLTAEDIESYNKEPVNYNNEEAN